MPCRLLHLDIPTTWDTLLTILSARNTPSQDLTHDVLAIINDVRKHGDAALMRYTQQFDAPKMTLPLQVSKEILKAAPSHISKEAYTAIGTAAKQIRTFHEAQKDRSWFLTQDDGTILGQRISPVDRAGLYVPGGQGGNTPLVSSLLMTAIPALVAGVPHISIVSPPRKDGTINPHILAAASLLGCDTVFAVGSAWAIAALAYGTESILPVDVIAGPGNIWVSTAKHLVQGHVGIDMIAGPSEILIIADDTADARCVAADMLSQAEHDTLASAICITNSQELADKVMQELATQVATLPRAEIAKKSLHEYGAVIVVPHIDTAIELANRIAPEHLEVLTQDPWQIMPRLRNAGAIFLGHHSPESLGDYLAGPNHVLPTCGTARFASGLSVQTFCKRTSIIAGSPQFAASHGACVAQLARIECLEAHARAMELRINK